MIQCFNPYSPGFSIYFFTNIHKQATFISCFNPYSPGFSIYLQSNGIQTEKGILLQSLFTWIFYLFRLINFVPSRTTSLLQSLFTWIFYLFQFNGFGKYKYRNCFNPYSPGFSIYFIHKAGYHKTDIKASILIHLDFLSILC